MALAYTAVWASDVLMLGPRAVGFLFVISGIAGAIGNPLIGMFSDRIGRRKPFIIVQLIASSCAMLGYVFTTNYAIAMFLVAFSGFGIMGLVLTSIGDILKTRVDLTGGRRLAVLSTERAAWAMGIIVGPALAALVVSLTEDVRLVFLGGSVLQIISVWLALGMRENSAMPHSRVTSSLNTPDWTLGRKAGLFFVVIGLIFVALPSQTRNIFVPLFITKVLFQPQSAVGPAFTINAITAVIAMPFLGALSNRIGAQRVLYMGILAGFIYCALQSVATSYPFALAIQIFIGLNIALWSTAGLFYLQQLLPDRGGTAGGLYLTVQQITPILTGLILGPIAEIYDIRTVFQVVAGAVLISAFLLVPAHRILSVRPGTG